jgi:hypothetical protein
METAMSILKRLFASSSTAGHAPSQPASQLFPASALPSRGATGQDNTSRRELLRLVLRDTLNRTGIPTSWIGADLLAATSRGRAPGIHIRLLLKHWDPRLLLHAVAFEQAFRKRVATLDPGSEEWLLGISWQFSLADESPCPALPHPGTWTSSPASAAPAAGAARPSAPSSGAADLLGGSIVISGPAAHPDSSAARPAAAAAIAPGAHDGANEPVTDARAEAKADLERLFAVRDADLQRHRGADTPVHHFAATEPAPLDALPASTRNGDTQAGELQKSFAKTDVFRRPERPTEPTRH